MTSITRLYEQFNTLATCMILFLAPILAGALAGAGGGGIAAAALLLLSIRWFVFWRRQQVVPLSPVVIALWILAALQALSLFGSINRDLTFKAIGFTLAAAAFAQLGYSVGAG
ncbi:MAG: hypothetical protein M3Y56_15655, partial [Armatimonadota bacterium]|nr:hypothetical protein [Armatimonadota bacterium]